MSDHHNMHYAIAGVDLEDAGFNVMADSDWAAPMSWATGRVQIAGRPGYTPLGGKVAEAFPVKITARIHATTQASLEAKRNEFMGLLRDPSAVLRRSSGGHVTEAPFTIEALTPGDFLAGTYADLVAVLSIHGGAFRSLTAKDHAAPVGTTALPIRGTEPVHDAVVRFAGPLVGTATVTDTATGTGISWSGSLFQGQYVFVDTWTTRAHIGTATSWGSGADATQGVDAPPAGRLTLTGRNGAPLGSLTVTDGDRTLPGAQMVQDPDTLLWRLSEPTAKPLPSTRTVTVRVTGAPAVIRAKEAWS